MTTETEHDPDVVDVGDDHLVRIIYSDEEETRIGALVLQHPNLNDPDQLCVGYAEVGAKEWEVIVRDPLTIHPSFICNDCGDHGLVIKGGWVTAREYTTLERDADKIPEWLYNALSFYFKSNEEIEHEYRKPRENYNLWSMRDLFHKRLYSDIGNILVEIRQEQKATNQ